MKKLILTTVVALTLSGVAYGFGGAKGGYGHHGGKGGFQKTQVIEQLNLDDEKKQALVDMLEQHKESRQALREDIKTKMQDLRTGHQSSIKALLGEEKFSEFENLMHQNRGMKKGWRKQAMQGGRYQSRGGYQGRPGHDQYGMSRGYGQQRMYGSRGYGRKCEMH